MIDGRVTTDGREAVIALDVLGREGRARRTEAVVDTGFTGYLAIPADAAASLGLPERGSETFMLADGSEAVLPVYRGEVLWHGKGLRIPIGQADGGVLIGMSLLRGSRLTVEARPGGETRIEEL